MRTLRILWLAMLSSVVIYYLLTLFVRRSADAEPNDMMSLLLVAIALTTTLISFVVKKQFVAQAADQQRVQLVQQGYLLAWVLCEVAALLGLLDYFAAAHRHYYILFIIGAAGHLLHFPRRDHVVNAVFKNPT